MDSKIIPGDYWNLRTLAEKTLRAVGIQRDLARPCQEAVTRDAKDLEDPDLARIEYVETFHPQWGGASPRGLAQLGG